MKKILSLLFVFTLVACGGNDDDEGGNSSDPLIGTWELIYIGEDASSYDTTFEVRSDGTYTLTDIFYIENEENDVNIDTGTWRNLSSDLNSLSQNYYITSEATSSADITVIFSSDFNSLTISTYSDCISSNCEWRRQ